MAGNSRAQSNVPVPYGATPTASDAVWLHPRKGSDQQHRCVKCATQSPPHGELWLDFLATITRSASLFRYERAHAARRLILSQFGVTQNRYVRLTVTGMSFHAGSNQPARA